MKLTREKYCAEVCRCNKEKCDKSKCPVWNAPAADVAPVIHAKWITAPHKSSRFCSKCYHDEPYKFADSNANIYNYCPHCGAKMDFEENPND